MMRSRTAGPIGVLMAFSLCAATSGLRADDRADVHSAARPREAAVDRVELDLAVDFAAKTLSGRADLRVEHGPEYRDGAPLILDARDLAIDRVEAGMDLAGLRPVKPEVGPARKFFGSAVSIPIRADDRWVRVHYKTSPAASALQWLEPRLTAGGVKPFLFSQSQAIHARSWIPIQDSPGVRVTYAATIRVGGGLRAVMSAEDRSKADEPGVFRFDMPQPIPAYLIALAVGDLTFRPIGARTGVYAEPATIDRAANEFADAEKMVEAVEKRFGPYRWGRYDILVLPPSFPFGGMENPRLTFVTPTVLAGDRSLVSLIAHELAHSWSGNLVTNATWRDFWLNEGVTTYLERRVVEDLYGRERAEIEEVLGLRDLKEEVATLPPGDQILAIDLSGRDPDDGVTRIPYEKGALLLRTLEREAGREAFDKFLLGYFDRRSFQSITTADFLKDLKAGLLDAHPKVAAAVDVDAWVMKPGLPERFAPTKSAALTRIDSASKSWLDGKVGVDALGAKSWSTQEWLHFLQGLPPTIGLDRMTSLDAAFGLTARGNSEIASQWLLRSIREGYEPAYGKLDSFLAGIGRRKLVVPLYKELAKTDEGRARAARIYAKARPGYHPITVETVDKIVGTP